MAGLLAASCGRPAAQGGYGGDAAAAADSAVCAVVAEAVTALPDTTMASASGIDFKVTVRDSLTPPEVDIATDLYASKDHVLTFRGGLRRDADFGGKVSGQPSEIIVDWTFHTDMDNRQTKYGTWGGGTGWTGQPLILSGSDGKKEVIVGSVSYKQKPTQQASQEGG